MDRCDFFKNLGFSEYESKLISSLVKLKTADVKEISLDSNVPRNKLYAIMRKFEEEGLYLYDAKPHLLKPILAEDIRALTGRQP